MDNPNENISEDADKLLFAEDLVSYVMTHLFNSPYEGTRATPYRRFIYNAFNETVKLAVKDFNRRVLSANESLFSNMDNIRDPDESYVREVLEELSDFQSPEGFDAKYFLLYCVQVAIIASKFRINGSEEAPNLAVTTIFEHLRDYDMLGGGWHDMHAVTSVYAKVSSDKSNRVKPDMVLNTNVQHRFLCNSCSGGLGWILADKMHYGTAAAGEKKDEAKIPVDDSANADTV